MFFLIRFWKLGYLIVYACENVSCFSFFNHLEMDIFENRYF